MTCLLFLKLRYLKNKTEQKKHFSNIQLIHRTSAPTFKSYPFFDRLLTIKRIISTSFINIALFKHSFSIKISSYVSKSAEEQKRFSIWQHIHILPPKNVMPNATYAHRHHTTRHANLILTVIQIAATIILEAAKDIFVNFDLVVS